ncbi:MAG: hypothetical protein NVS1B4_00230 [Gemmatimonadaceae bacterium]
MTPSTFRALAHYLLAALLWWLVFRVLARTGVVDLSIALDVVAVIGLAVATARWTVRLAEDAYNLDRGPGDYSTRPLTAQMLAEETAPLRHLGEVAHDVRCPACGHPLPHGRLPLGLLTECPHCHSGVSVRMEGGKPEVRLTGV